MCANERRSTGVATQKMRAIQTGIRLRTIVKARINPREMETSSATHMAVTSHLVGQVILLPSSLVPVWPAKSQPRFVVNTCLRIDPLSVGKYCDVWTLDSRCIKVVA